MQRATRAATLLTAAMAAVPAAQAVLHGEPSASPGRKAPVTESVSIRLASETVTATLEAGAAARAFRALLPATGLPRVHKV